MHADAGAGGNQAEQRDGVGGLLGRGRRKPVLSEGRHLLGHELGMECLAQGDERLGCELLEGPGDCPNREQAEPSGTGLAAALHRALGVKSCTRMLRPGTSTRTSHQGSNSVAFSGRIGAKALTPGNYAATLTATAGSTQTSKPLTVHLHDRRGPGRRR